VREALESSYKIGREERSIPIKMKVDFLVFSLKRRIFIQATIEDSNFTLGLIHSKEKLLLK